MAASREPGPVRLSASQRGGSHAESCMDWRPRRRQIKGDGSVGTVERDRVYRPTSCAAIDHASPAGDSVVTAPGESHPLRSTLVWLCRSAWCADAAFPLLATAADGPQWQYSGEYGPMHWGKLHDAHLLADGKFLTADIRNCRVLIIDPKDNTIDSQWGQPGQVPTIRHGSWHFPMAPRRSTTAISSSRESATRGSRESRVMAKCSGACAHHTFATRPTPFRRSPGSG